MCKYGVDEASESVQKKGSKSKNLESRPRDSKKAAEKGKTLNSEYYRHGIRAMLKHLKLGEKKNRREKKRPAGGKSQGQNEKPKSRGGGEQHYCLERLSTGKALPQKRGKKPSRGGGSLLKGLRYH